MYIRTAAQSFSVSIGQRAVNGHILSLFISFSAKIFFSIQNPNRLKLCIQLKLATQRVLLGFENMLF